MLGSTLQVCTFMFLGEMILKLIAFKFRGYIKSRWNIFDGVVVVISLIDTVLTLSNLIDNTGTSVLRSFRLVSILIEVLKNGLKYFSLSLLESGTSRPARSCKLRFSYPRIGGNFVFSFITFFEFAAFLAIKFWFIYITVSFLGVLSRFVF